MRTLNDYFITFKITDVSTAGQVYVPVPDDGRIIKVITALNGAIGTADVDLTVKTAIGTAGVITIATSSSAAGDVDTLEPTTNNEVVEGQTIEIETDGASSNTVSVDGVIIIRR
jgi:hypothetical protein